MHIADKILLDAAGLQKEGPITIVAFGDSVTHGALLNEINYETVYWNLLRKKILQVRNYVPVNVINAGIGGTDATQSLKRIDRQVLDHHPDLVIVCFGLNDVGGELSAYLAALRGIFEECKRSGADVIFMTPNMLNTYVAADTPEQYRDYAVRTAEWQNGGRMDAFMQAAVTLAGEMEVPVCDCYARWKALAKMQDTTALLINRINHPAPEMHRLFADALFAMLFPNPPEKVPENASTMTDQKS